MGLEGVKGKQAIGDVCEQLPQLGPTQWLWGGRDGGVWGNSKVNVAFVDGMGPEGRG